MREFHITSPTTEGEVRQPEIGDIVYLSGIVYITRDLSHKRIVELLSQNEPLPVDLRGATIFHAGPLVQKEEDRWHIVNVGPTTSPRMNPYTPQVIEAGVRVIAGKGSMDDETLKAMKTHGAIFLAPASGCANVHVQHIKGLMEVHWLDLGTTEAIWVVRVEQWGPLTVAMDAHGNNLFEKVVIRARERLKEAFG
jgi:tartrate/fumarate subfamily iron-sulfur-dependent hydro-lyase beta chain